MSIGSNGRMDGAFLTSIAPPTVTDVVKKVNKITYVQKSPRQAPEEENKFNIDDLVVPQDTDVMQTENKLYDLQDTLHDSNRDIRK